MTKSIITCICAIAIFGIAAFVSDHVSMNVHAEPANVFFVGLVLALSGLTAIVSALIAAGTFIYRKLKK
jgi:hypothetical protein